MRQDMTVQDHPVFATPQIDATAVDRARPVDLVLLARQTGGDRVLEEEVLRLFLKQAKAIGRAMADQADAERRQRDAHTLKGAARAIGAGAIADTAQALEKAPAERRCVRALLTEIDRTCDYINSLMR